MKKYIIWPVIGIVILVICIFSLKGCITGISKNDIRSNIESTIDSIGRGSDDDGHTLEEILMEELIVTLEPFDDLGCVEDNLGCIEDCFDELEPCEEEYYSCDNDCDEEFPITDEIEECWDNCAIDGMECIDICDEIEDDDEYDICREECGDIWDDCDIDCDIEYIECSEDCSYLMNPCVENIVDCIYGCLIECIAGEESVMWDGNEVTDIGTFYATSFPDFNNQFENVCEWLIMGDFVSTPEQYGCVDIGFFGDWFAPYMDSIESMQNVCETISKDFIMNDDEITCNI